MEMSKRTLEAVIHAALKQAAAENRLDVAEHLLHALEILAEETQPQRHLSARNSQGS